MNIDAVFGAIGVIGAAFGFAALTFFVVDRVRLRRSEKRAASIREAYRLGVEDAAAERKRKACAELITCVGCGCNDLDACEPPCHWLVIDREKMVGVCSDPSCDDYIEPFCGGDMTLSDRARDRIDERLTFGGPV